MAGKFRDLISGKYSKKVKGIGKHSKELIEPLPRRQWGLKDRFVQGGAS